MRAVQITQFGGPEQLRVVELPDPTPSPGQQVFDVLAAGVNYADTHQTEDSYLAKQVLPLIPGGEVVVRAPDGRRLIGLVGSGGYAEKVAVHPQLLIPIPDEVDDAAALTTLVQGATAWHLLRTSARMEPGESVVVHAGAGGVGTIAIQLAKRWGAGRVIATASSPEKRELASTLGADAVVDSTVGELRQVLIEANGGHRVDIVLEMTGGRVFDESLAALAPFGRIAVFGQASRQAATPVAPANLMAHSTAVIGFWLVHVARRPERLAAAISELLGMIARGELRPVIGKIYSLTQVAEAHRALLARETVGKLVLDPRR